nr:MAG TPA: hypothetical protein [Caudoviricetes sp.]
MYNQCARETALLRSPSRERLMFPPFVSFSLLFYE